MKPINLTGEVFGRLTVLKGPFVSLRRKRYWQCRCECGNTTLVPTEKLTRGHTKSCGCLFLEIIASGANVKHGCARTNKKTREYKRWEGMIKRCHNPNSSRYQFYGAKGITVCDSWRESFTKFMGDMGVCPDGYELDRIDNQKGYSPDNCRWTSLKANKRNMSNNRRVTIGRETKTVIEWCELLGFSPQVVYQRIYRGWPEAEWFRPVGAKRVGRGQRRDQKTRATK